MIMARKKESISWSCSPGPTTHRPKSLEMRSVALVSSQPQESMDSMPMKIRANIPSKIKAEWIFQLAFAF